MLAYDCDGNCLMNTCKNSSESGATSVARATRSGRVSKPRDMHMFTPPEHKRDNATRKSNRIRTEKVAYTPPLTPTDRKRKQRCLQGEKKTRVRQTSDTTGPCAETS